MSGIPARTRSLRKPTIGINQDDRTISIPSSTTDSSTSPRATAPILKAPQLRSRDTSPVRSPSRLPQPHTSTSSSIARPSRPNSSAGTSSLSTMRPPPRSAAGIISRPPLTSDNHNNNNMTPSLRSGARTPTEPNTSLQRRPSGAAATSRPRPLSISRPPLTSDNIKTPASRSGARTPTEPNTSLQRRPSASAGSRSTQQQHTRNASAAPLSSSSSGTIASVRLASRSTHARAISAVDPSTKTTHARTASIIAITAATVLHPPSSQSQGSPKPKSPTTHGFSASVSNPPLLHKPAFTTLQQHFSPLKSHGPKPATSTFFVPPSPSKLPSNQLISAETARLQAELLQLHLLHQAAPSSLKEYRASGKRKLEARFEKLKGEHEVLVGRERVVRGRVNAVALASWDGSSAAGGGGLEEKIRVLDAVVSGVWGASEPGGKFARVVRRFEKWISRVEEVLEGRKTGGGGATLKADLFVKRLDATWRDDCEALERKLEPWKEALKSLGPVDREESSLAIVMRGMAALVGGMVEELRVMREVEEVVARGEEEWVRGMLELESDGDDRTSEGEEDVPGAIWRLF